MIENITSEQELDDVANEVYYKLLGKKPPLRLEERKAFRAYFEQLGCRKQPWSKWGNGSWTLSKPPINIHGEESRSTCSLIIMPYERNNLRYTWPMYSKRQVIKSISLNDMKAKLLELSNDPIFKECFADLKKKGISIL